MKKHTHKLLMFAMVCLISLSANNLAKAQQKLIYYWHFDNINTGVSAAGSPSVLKPIHANWSSMDSTKALIAYLPAYTVSSKYATYWDGVAGDTTNSRLKYKGVTAGNQGLRVRNPSDSMQMIFTLPTPHYKNITISYALEKSSTASGQAKQVFDYSVDGGKTWKTKGLSIPGDSVPNANWNLITFNLKADTLVNNNLGFVFRIKFVGNNSGTSGNNRFDNITIEGDTLKGGTPPSPPAGKKLIHYWHFNNLNTGLTAAVVPSAIPSIHANWSSLDSTKALITYTAAAKVSSKYMTYWDAVTPGDTLNARRNFKNQTIGTNAALRVRNPSDSMQMQFIMPTTHYRNVRFSFATEKSSLTSGQGKQVFDYSLDNGTTWKKTGLSIASDSATNVVFNLVTVTFAADTFVYNNPNFIFRIMFKSLNTGTSGNNRFDNVVLEGDTATGTPQKVHNGGISTNSEVINCTVYPNPAQNNITIATGSKKEKSVVVYNMAGQAVYTVNNRMSDISINVANLNNGVYFIKVLDIESGNIAYSKFVKN